MLRTGRIRALRRRGFTLIELLVVIVILGILIAVAVPTFLAQQTKAQDSRTQQYLTTAFKAIRSGTVGSNTYPAPASMVSWIQQSEPELTALTGSCISTVQTAQQDAVLVDSSSSSNSLTLCSRSQSGNIWKLTASATGAQELLDGTLIPFTFSGNEITDTSRAANVQGDGLSGDSSTGIFEATTNMLANGGAETATAPPWTANGLGTISRTNTTAKFGSYSWRYDAAGTDPNWSPGIGETTPTGLNGAAGTAYTISAWLNGGNSKSFELLERQYYTDATSQDFPSTCFTPASGWTYHTDTAIVPSGKTLDKIDFQLRPCSLEFDSIFGPWTMWIDGMQLEKFPYATPYVDTSGTSASRGAARVRAPATLLSAGQGWVAARVRIGWSAASRTDFPILFSWDTDTSNRLGIIYNGPSGRWAMDSRTGGAGNDAEPPATETFQAGDFLTIIGTWSSSTLALSVNGAAFNTAPNTHFLTPSGTTFDIGTNLGSSPFDGDILWFAAGTGTLTSADAATINGWGNQDPKVAAFPSAAQTTFVWNGESTSGSMK